MKKDRFKLIATVNFLIEKNGKLLLMKRSDGFFKGGFWVAPAGHLDGYETIPQASIRELKEELDIDVLEKDLKVVHLVHNLEHTLEKFDIFIKVNHYTGQIKNIETSKCDEIQFFSYQHLPDPEMMSSTTLLAIQEINKGNIYSERGFIEQKSGFSKYDRLTFDGLENILEEKYKSCLDKNILVLDSLEKLKDISSKTEITTADVKKAFLALSTISFLKEMSIKEILYDALYEPDIKK